MAPMLRIFCVFSAFPFSSLSHLQEVTSFLRIDASTRGAHQLEGTPRTPSELAWWSRWKMSPSVGPLRPHCPGYQGQLGRLLVSFHPLPQAPPHWRERCGGQPPSSPSNTQVRLGGPLSAPCSSLQVGGADGSPTADLRLRVDLTTKPRGPENWL